MTEGNSWAAWSSLRWAIHNKAVEDHDNKPVGLTFLQVKELTNWVAANPGYVE